MKIWIINPYGNLPGEGWREHRSTMIANAFAKYGHDVVWWVSNFDHRSKIFKSDSWKDIKVNDRYRIRMVPSTSYSGHLSFARIRYERTFANNFRKRVLESDDKPDLIIMGEPALFTSDIILDVIRKKKIPFIVDIIDLWPELFNIILPNKISFLGRFIFAPLYWRRSWLLRRADGIIAVSKDYLKIGISKNKTPLTEVVYWGMDLKDIEPINNLKFKNKILESLVKKDGETWVIYAGTLGDNYDIPTIIKCAQQIEELKLPIKIFLAGDGSLRSLIEETIKTKNLKNLVYLGKLTANDLNIFYQKCDLALSSYVQSSTVSMPIKAFDSFAAGLPLINSLKRDLGDFVIQHKVGLQYKAEDAEDMLRAIRQLAENKDTLNRMKANAYILAESFDCSRQYEKLVTLAEKLVEEKKVIN